MKTVNFTLSVFLLITLAIFLAGCSGDGQDTEVVEPTVAATEETTGPASATPSGLQSESCTDQGTGTSMDFAEALAIAESSQCVQEGQLLETHFCNENSGTWWIDMAADMAGCSPACVVSVNSGASEINWRCTGALPPADDE